MIPVSAPLLDGNEGKYLQECIDTGWISSEGPFVKEFETGMAEMCQRKNAIAVTNGTTALEAVCAAVGIGPGDEVIMPTFTIISCAAAVVRLNATPVLVDCQPDSWCMDVSAVEARITEKTKAILAVHIYGLPVDMQTLSDIAQKHNLALIEDAAEAHGLDCYRKPCGSWGAISTFSFYSNKNITTGEGGMILTDDDKLAEQCRSLRNLCFQKEQRFVHKELGWNMRMSNIQAALGVAQLERLSSHIQRKKEIGQHYQSLLQDCPHIQLPLESTAVGENHYWVFGIVLSQNSPLTSKQLAQRLAEQKIGTRPFFYPMHKQPVFLDMGWYENDHHPHAEHLSAHGLYLPTGPAITDEEIEIVASSVMQHLSNG